MQLRTPAPSRTREASQQTQGIGTATGFCDGYGCWDFANHRMSRPSEKQFKRPLLCANARSRWQNCRLSALRLRYSEGLHNVGTCFENLTELPDLAGYVWQRHCRHKATAARKRRRAHACTGRRAEVIPDDSRTPGACNCSEVQTA